MEAHARAEGETNGDVHAGTTQEGNIQPQRHRGLAEIPDLNLHNPMTLKSSVVCPKSSISPYYKKIKNINDDVYLQGLSSVRI